MKTRKLFIADVEHPWITWDKDLYVLQERSRNKPDDHMQFYGIELVASPWQADLFWINRDAVDIRDHVFKGKEVFMFIDEIEPNAQHELSVLADVKYAEEQGWTIVTESPTAFDKLESVKLTNEPWLWRRPSRVSTDAMLDECPLDQRDDLIDAVFDAGHPLGHCADLVKAYLGAMVILRDDHDIEPELHIYSHTEMPFEPFNEVRFQGFVSNKKLHKAIKKAKLAIWPAEVETYPSTLLEAAQLGVPCMQFTPAETPVKYHTVFHDLDWANYADVDELTTRIIDHFAKSKSEKGFLNTRCSESKSVVVEEDMPFGLEIFLTELSRRVHEEV